MQALSNTCLINLKEGRNIFSLLLQCSPLDFSNGTLWCKCPASYLVQVGINVCIRTLNNHMFVVLEVGMHTIGLKLILS